MADKTKWTDYKKASRSNWGTELPKDQNLNREQIQLGAILRIADATEAMAENYVKLQSDLAWYKENYYKAIGRCNDRDRTISALKGHITRLKNKLENAGQDAVH